MTPQSAKLLRIYMNEQDQYGGKPLYEAIVDRCRELNLAGVTVFRAFEGFGETAELHRKHLFRNDQSIVITIIERPENVALAVTEFESMMNSGMIAVTDVEVMVVSNGAKGALP
jgi:PII-like signaling protein